MRTVTLLPDPRELAACAAFLRAQPDLDVLPGAPAVAPPGLPGALGLLHEAELAAGGRANRRALGRFYTPVPLARQMARMALGSRVYAAVRIARAAIARGDAAGVATAHKRLLALTVADPAAGGGIFLLAALEWLVAGYRMLDHLLAQVGATPHPLPPTARALAHNLSGMDLDAQAIAVARRALGLAARLCDGSAPAHAPRLQVGDALVVDAWPTGQPQVLLGNPPWGGWLSPEQVERLSQRLDLPARNLNTFAAFVAQGARLLAPGGSLCFVVPKNLIKADGYQDLRKWLLAETELRTIRDVGAFPGVTSEAVVLHLLRRRPAPTHAVRLQGWQAHVHRLPQTTLTTLPSSIWPVHISQTLLRVLDRMRAHSTPLQHWLTVARGEETGYPGDMALCPHCGLYRPRPKQLGRAPVQPCPHCQRSVDLRTAPVRSVLAAEPTPLHTEPILLGRDIEPFVIVGQHWLDPAIPGRRTKPAALYAGPKLLVRKISHRLLAALDGTDRRCTQGLYVLRPRRPGPPLAALAAWLNSDLLDAYYQLAYNLGAELTTNVVATHLYALPLPAATPALWQELAALGERCAAGDSAARALLETYVARLYGLDESEQAALCAARAKLYARPVREGARRS